MTDLAHEVIAMVAEVTEVRRDRLNPTSRLFADLGMDGDDAVEFFAAFEARFRVDLAVLHAHWGRHFGPEGWGFSDVRANWAVLAGLCVSGVALSGWLPAWSAGLGLALGVAALAGGSVFGWVQGRKNRPHLEITISDLVAAAEGGRWPIAYGEVRGG